MSTETLANYLNEKRVQAGLTYEAVAALSNRPESTVKNLCTGKTEDPRLETVIPVMKAVGGSFDEMLHPEKSKDEIKEASVSFPDLLGAKQKPHVLPLLNTICSVPN